MPKPRLIIGDRNYSSWSLRPYMALAMAGIDFEQKLIRFTDPQFSAKVARISKARLVPILKHNDLVIWDSLAILEYLAEAWPTKNLWPKNKSARTYARCISAEMHSGFGNLRSACPMNLRRPVKPVSMNADVRSDIARLEQIFATARKAFGKGGPFLFGKFSNADAMFTPILTRFETFDIPVSTNTREYMNAILATPAFHAWKASALKETDIYPADEVD
ncbi:MAG: glutathione S-transferase family protein [Aestuariivirga sp.]